MTPLLLFGTLLLQQLAPVAGPDAVSGRVLHTDGQVATAVWVSMTPAGSNDNAGLLVSQLTSSDATGVYRFGNVQPGRYRIHASAVGMSVYYPPGSDVEAFETVTVTAGARGNGPNFTMALLSNPTARAADPEARKKDSYAIYSKLLPTVIAPEANAIYLIREKKASGGEDLPEPSQAHCTIQPRHQPSWNEVLSDLNASRNLAGNLERALTLPKPYLLASDDEIRQFTATILTGLVAGPPPPTHDPRFEGTKRLYTLSDVFFNRTQTIGLVYVTTWCGFTCGNGGWRIFEKTIDDDWAEVRGVCPTWTA